MAPNTSAEKVIEEAPVVQTIPFNPISSRREARRANIAKISETSNLNRIKRQGKASLSDNTIAQLVMLADAGVDNKEEILTVLNDYEITTEKLNEVRNLIATEPLRFRTDKHSIRFESLGLVPEANFPRAFDVAPGTNVPETDSLYFPNRFSVEPDLDNYQDSDLIYSVHEDGSYTVLSAAQQTPEFQATHHMPAMNLLYRVGGGEAQNAAVKPEVKKDSRKAK